MKVTSMGELEREVMEIIWNCGQCSVREVFSQLKKHRKIAYTTVATVLQRLHNKGLVRKKEIGQIYFYSPKVSKEVYSKNLALSFLSKFINSFGDIAIVSFAESIDKLPRKKRRELVELLEQHDKAK